MNGYRTDVTTPVDIALLLEGTYPYVTGGVSSWVYQLIRSFPHYRFAVVFLGGRRQDYSRPAYPLPPNVVHMEEHFLHEETPAPRARSCPRNSMAFSQVEQLHEAFKAGDNPSMAQLLQAVLPLMDHDQCLSEHAFLKSRDSWDMITRQFEKHSNDPSFTDYFWTVRLMHRPVWQLARLSRQLVPARIYHTISTGYAGFLGALLRYRGDGRLLVSEHGIYTKERKIELLQSDWIRDNRSLLESDSSQVGYLRELWMRFFQTMGRICYEAADDITSLYEGNRQRQIHEGAPEEKTQVIPNGVALDRFTPLRHGRSPTTPPVVALIGRVVPIKDVKTFIRALFIARRTMPTLRGWIIGPDDEDPAYAKECRELAASLGGADEVEFLGSQKIDDFLPKIGLVALSSISEGLPLVMIEAFAAGIPVVATDVGSCRILVEGDRDADRALGQAGSIVPIANPQRMAQALLHLLTDEQAWLAAQRAAIARVHAHYSETTMQASYAALYEKLMQKSSDTVEAD